MSLPSRRLPWLAMGALVLGCLGLELSGLLAWCTLALVVAAGLKLREARSRDGRRQVALVQLICCGLLAAQLPGLLPSLLQLIATVLILAGLLSLESETSLSWSLLIRRSLRVLAASLPLALVLFLLVPRIGPLGNGDGRHGARGTTGLSEELDPGSIAVLASDEAPAARVAFAGDRPPAPGDRYWRVLVHPSFDGRRWQRQPSDFRALPSGPLGQTADQLWLVEPSRFTAVPWDGRSLPLDGRLRLDPLGELQLDQPPANARAYPMDTVAAAPDWQRAPPRPADLRLPAGGEPRLRALAEGWRRLAEPQQRVAAAQSWFLNAGFRYDTQPGPLPERDGLDAFLFTTRVGFCGHYASAFTALMRAAGVPARVVTGYFGGDWVVPLGGSPYLELRQSDAHAWSEVWLPESGWNRIDPSSWATGSPETTVRAAEGSPARAGRLNPWQWLQRQWWGLDVAWSRWWLGFDRAGQEALLQRLFGANRHWLGWTILAALVIGLLAGLALVGRWGRQPRQDWLERDLKRLLSLLSRLAIPARPGESLQSLCDRAGQRHPSLAPLLADLAERHALLRFAAPPSDGNEARRARQAWKLALRQLKRSCQDAIRQQTSSTP